MQQAVDAPYPGGRSAGDFYGSEWGDYSEEIFTDRGTVCICKAVCGKSVAGSGMPGGDL